MIRVVRVRPPRVVPVEIWDLLVGPAFASIGPILSDLIATPAFPGALRAALEALHDGSARVRSGDRSPRACRGFGTVVVCGGAARPELGAALAGARFAHRVAPGEFGGEGAIATLLPGAALVDVGQTGIKISTAHGRLRLPRDPVRLPIDGAPSPAARRELVGYLAEAMSLACPRPTPAAPTRLILALPCTVSDTLVPGPCTYAGLAGDRDLIRDALAAARLADEVGPGGRGEVVVLNDAELVAVAVAAGPAAPDGLTLVVTLGFGVGGALIDAAGVAGGPDPAPPVGGGGRSPHPSIVPPLAPVDPC